MFNFEYHNPTKLIFGKDQIAALTKELPENAKILLTYGGGSIKGNGVYEQVITALDGFDVIEFSGIEPNPTYETLMKAVEQAREHHVDFLLAVGGGSVVDGTKFIAAATHYSGEAWDILTKRVRLEAVVPMGCVLTLPATGSESNGGAVITKKETQDKMGFGNPLLRPQFAVLDPQVTYSLPERQIANGIVDAFVHVMEQYLTYPVNAAVQDRFAEGLLQTLIEEGPKALAEPENYDVRANVMFSATLALNGLIGSGVPQDWSTHMIGHELTGLFAIDHARTLAILLPSVMQHQHVNKREKLLQYAQRVWGISDVSEDETIVHVIKKTREFFESLGVPTHLSDYQISEAQFDAIIEKLSEHKMTRLGEHRKITLDDARDILTLSL